MTRRRRLLLLQWLAIVAALIIGLMVGATYRLGALATALITAGTGAVLIAPIFVGVLRDIRRRGRKDDPPPSG
jgi:hypothetical protein